MENFTNIMILVLLASIFFTNGNEEVNAKVRNLDRKLDRIMDHLGIEDLNYDEELKDFLNDGKKIKAIKYLREKTGMGLKEAKDYVDKLEEEFLNK